MEASKYHCRGPNWGRLNYKFLLDSWLNLYFTNVTNMINLDINEKYGVNSNHGWVRMDVILYLNFGILKVF